MKQSLLFLFIITSTLYSCKKANDPKPSGAGGTGPSSLSYTSPNNFKAGIAITPLNPTVTGTVTSYSVNPGLPAGLTLNSGTGVITGTPSTVTPQGTYTITATNSSGSTTFNLQITILAHNSNVYVPDNSFKIVAYFPSYQNPDSVDISKYKMITHLYYAFITPKADGSLNNLPQQARFDKVIAAARANGAKVGIAVADASSFPALAADASARTNFVKNILAFVKQNNLDGVDMDWEYPRADVSGTDVTYLALIKELSDTLHNNNKYLSAAITSGVYSGAVRDGFKNENFQYLDFINIMIYDGGGYQGDPQHASWNMTIASLNYWIDVRGMPKEKVVLGIPSYGKDRSSPSNNSAGYRALINAGAKAHLDSASYTKPPGNVRTVYYYNGTKTVKNKTMLAKQRGNGIMMWEMYFDTNGPTSLLKAANDTLGRSY